MKTFTFAIILVAVVIVGSGVAGTFFYLHNQVSTSHNQGQLASNSSGAPIWHTFTNVFEAGCNPVNCGSNYYIVSSNCNYGTNTLTCSYDGIAYYGYGGALSTPVAMVYCNLNPNGVIPQVNGTSVPYLGCILSRAPITQTFSGLYTLSGSGSQISMADSNGNQIPVYPTSVFQSDSCSYQSTGGVVNGFWSPDGSGILTCVFLGMSYSGETPSTCNLGIPIQVNGQAVPQDSCILTRNG